MKIPSEVGSKYRFIILSGQRVAQLQKGAKPRLDMPHDNEKKTHIAMKELMDGKLLFQKITPEDENTEQETNDNLVTDA